MDSKPYNKAVLGVGFPLEKPYLRTAYIGEDSSILDTWNVWWLLKPLTVGQGPKWYQKVPWESLFLLKQESYSMNWNTRKIMDAPWLKKWRTKMQQRKSGEDFRVKPLMGQKSCTSWY